MLPPLWVAISGLWRIKGTRLNRSRNLFWTGEQPGSRQSTLERKCVNGRWRIYLTLSSISDSHCQARSSYQSKGETHHPLFKKSIRLTQSNFMCAYSKASTLLPYLAPAHKQLHQIMVRYLGARFMLTQPYCF